MATSLHPADIALQKAQDGEPLSVNDRWAIHRRLLHLRSAIDMRATDDVQHSRELLARYSAALNGR
jgi:hypothetical protein